MTSATGHPFRFLDLPAELRCRVYEYIEFSSTLHTLDRTQALIKTRDWPVPPKAQVYDSRVTLIQPHTPLAINILVTCHLINKEARPILKRKVEHCRAQPVRYLVDYSAAWAIVAGSSALRSCLGVADWWPFRRRENRAVRSFLQTCALALSRTRQTQDETRNGTQDETRNDTQDGTLNRTQNGSRGIRTIEITITHKSEIVYGRELMDTMIWLSALDYYSPNRLVFIYKSPLPKISTLPTTQMIDSNVFEEQLLQNIPREPGNIDQTSPGVFVRPLREEAYRTHVAGLEFY